MPITLESVQANLADDIDYTSIDELRRESPFLLDRLEFSDTVIPGVGGGTLTAGYTRQSMTRSAHTRQENTEYPAFEAKKTRVTVDLVPMGARYNIDRVHARIGAADEVSFQQGEALKATVQKFNDLFINGIDGRSFASEVPEFEGIDSIVSGTITDSTQPNGDPWNFATFADKNAALVAQRALRAWLRLMDGDPTVFLVNKDGAAWLDMVNDYIGYYTTGSDSFGRDVQLYRGIPYVDLGYKPGSVDQNDVLTGVASEDEVIATTDGVTSIYAVRLGLDSVHGYSLGNGGGLFDQWFPNFDDAGAVKPGEVELGPVAIAAKKVRGVGAFRVRVAA